MAVLTENDFMKRIKGGYLITHILDKMMKKVNNNLTPDRRLFLYSGHDTTLMNVMRALNITGQTTNKPDFTSSLHFELHQNLSVEGKFDVKVRNVHFYKSIAFLVLIFTQKCKFHLHV